MKISNCSSEANFRWNLYILVLKSKLGCDTDNDQNCIYDIALSCHCFFKHSIIVVSFTKPIRFII